jgi:L-iditol 2-dehydrogenase
MKAPIFGITIAVKNLPTRCANTRIETSAAEEKPGVIGNVQERWSHSSLPRPCVRDNPNKINIGAASPRPNRTWFALSYAPVPVILPVAMQAALLYDKDDLRLEERPTPVIAHGEVLLRTASASVCGTDLRMWQNGHAFATPERPLIIGHEMSGTIADVGPGVTDYRVGQRVCVAPNYNPVRTALVARGEGHLDPSYRALGIHEHGAFAEFVRIPREAVEQGNIFPLPQDVSFAAAALVEPLACVYNAFEKARPGPGDVVLIIGAGPIGVMHAKLARMARPRKVILCDVNPQRLELARSLDHEFIIIAGDPGDEIARQSDGAGADIIITACPSAEMQARAIELAAVNGRVIFFGGLPKGRSLVPLDTNLIHYRQLIVTGTTRQSLQHFARMLELIAQRQIEVEDLITSTHTLAQIHVAMADAARGHGLKARIAFTD